MPEKKSVTKILWAVIVRELHRLVSRPIYIFCIIIAPLISYLFLLTLMNEGLPEEIPTAVVDLDHSAASRNFIRQLDAMSLTQVTEQPNSFTEARESLQKGEIYGFLVIPENFEAKAMAGRRPEISFYTNNAYYIPASLLYKNFKTMSVLASGAIVQQTLLAHGEYGYEIMPQLQPVPTAVHELETLG